MVSLVLLTVEQVYYDVTFQWPLQLVIMPLFYFQSQAVILEVLGVNGGVVGRHGVEDEPIILLRFPKPSLIHSCTPSKNAAADRLQESHSCSLLLESLNSAFLHTITLIQEVCKYPLSIIKIMQIIQ